MSVLNSGHGFLSANIGPGAQYNNNAAGTQYNYNYYPATPDIDRGPPKSEKEECLQSLGFSTINARRQDIDLAHPDTADWLFETSVFRQWRDRTNLSTHNGVLWIKGHPGSGKSTLMKHIWSHCQQELKDRTIAAYFFHARGEALEKTPLGMLRSLVYQLLDKDEAMYQRFIPLFREKYRIRGKELEWRESELKDFLLSEMRVHQRKPIVLLVDALDECRESDVREVARFFEQLSLKYIHHRADVSICLSSRHYPHISMATYKELAVEAMKEHDNDIAKYVHDSLKCRNPDIEMRVVEKASGIFMWVVLVIAMLNEAYDKGKVEAMQQKLREVPKDLDELFSTMLSGDDPDRQETILMLEWVLFAVRAITPEELYFGTLAGTNPKKLGPWDSSQVTPDDIRRRIIHSSKGLIAIREGEGGEWGPYRLVEFIHESVVDFLLGNQRLQSLDPTLESNPIGKCHDRLKACCVSYITMTALVPGYDPKMRRKQYPFLLYAMFYFMTHAKEAHAYHVSQEGFLRQLREKYGDDLPQCLWGRGREVQSGWSAPYYYGDKDK